MNPISDEPLKGMQDLHPLLMRQHLYVKACIHKVAEAFSYEEYQLPVLERKETFAHQEGTELLAEQAYAFTDRGGRDVLLRPEITPCLARMAVRASGQYQFPLRWYTVAACYRYEKPQKGRLREFSQLNFDLLGSPDHANDLEPFALIDALMETCAVPDDAYRVAYNHRGLVNVLLRIQGFSPVEKKQFYALMDRRDKLGGPEGSAFSQAVAKTFVETSHREFVSKCAHAHKSDELLHSSMPAWKKLTDEERATITAFKAFEKNICESGLRVIPTFDPGIVRGLEYYTGIVFEVFAKKGDINRSLIGGGRYDDLATRYGHSSSQLSSGRQLSGVGLGMGIHIFILFLKELDLLPQELPKTHNVYIAPVAEDLLALSWKIARKLQRHEKRYTILMGRSLKRTKHMERAHKAGASHIVFVDASEQDTQTFTLEKLKTKTVSKIPVEG